MWGDAIHIPLNAGVASSTDMILIPEIPYRAYLRSFTGIKLS